MTKAQFVAVSFAALAALSGMFLWHDQFRYAGLGSVEVDRWRGKSTDALLASLGEPQARVGNDESIGLEPNHGADRTWTYDTTFGTLKIYLRGDMCVGSIYFDRNVRF